MSCGFVIPKENDISCDSKFLKYKGFEIADKVDLYHELPYLSFDKSADKPRFKANAKTPKIKEQGFVLYFANQCKFTSYSLFYNGDFGKYEILSYKNSKK